MSTNMLEWFSFPSYASRWFTGAIGIILLLFGMIIGHLIGRTQGKLETTELRNQWLESANNSLMDENLELLDMLKQCESVNSSDTTRTALWQEFGY